MIHGPRTLPSPRSHSRPRQQSRSNRPRWASCWLLLLLSCAELAPRSQPAQEPSRPDSPEWTEIKQRIRSTFPTVREVSTKQLASELSAATSPDERPLLLDARPESEYSVSHLQGALCVSPEVLARIPKDRAIVVYCSVGYRSAELAQRLDQLGYRQVRNLEGSIFQWANEGRPLYSGGRRVQRVHPYDSEWGRLLAPSHH